MRKIVVDTSPLQYLHQLGHLDIAQRLYGEIVVPEAVVRELGQGLQQGVDVPQCENYTWILRQTVQMSGHLSFTAGLGEGEKAVIALALDYEKRGNSTLVILDDKLARRYAAGAGLTVTGTLGVLLKARKQGYIEAILPLMAQLATLGFRCSAATVDHIRSLSGE